MQRGAFSILIDGGYRLPFSTDIHTYTVLLPAGRPRVPKVSVESDGQLRVKIMQAVIADTQMCGHAYVDLFDASGTKQTYTITFQKDSALGFHLQYADSYRFTPASNYHDLQFVSEAPGILSVNADGIVTAHTCSDLPIRIFAKRGTDIVDTLTVDKVIKAPVNLFLITGQSNAAGTYDIPEGENEQAFTAAQIALAECPPKGTSFCLDVSHLGEIGEKGIYDLSEGRAGFSPALGKRWYELTGEKTIMLQSAVGGAPIEAWMKPNSETRYTYGNIRSNFYETTRLGYNYILDAINATDSGFTLDKVYAFWLQGETGMANTYNPDKDGVGVGNWEFGDLSGIHSSAEYYDMFMQNMQYFKKDFGCEFMGILLVRATYRVVSEESLRLQLYTELVPPRAAQYMLNNTSENDISIVSRVCDIARSASYDDKSDIGYALIGCNNLHYNQTGHNQNGLAAAENTFKKHYGREMCAAREIELIDFDGRHRFAEGEVLTLHPGESRQITAVVLPLFTDTPKVIYEISDTDVGEIDRFGMITVAADASGKKVSLTVVCKEANLQKQIMLSIQ